MRVLLACVLVVWAGLAQAACRQALALGLDVSGSVDAEEYRLQMRGLANALRHPEVEAALLAMPSAPVSLAVFEWSGPMDQRLTLDWRAVTDAATLSEIAAHLATVARGPGDPSTAIGSALRFGAALLDQRSTCWKRTLDLSGDGTSNTGPHPRDSHASLGADVTVNALVIGKPARTTQVSPGLGELSSYFRAYVIHGPDAFVETALGFEDFEAAMVRKLKRELQGQMFSRR